MADSFLIKYREGDTRKISLGRFALLDVYDIHVRVNCEPLVHFTLQRLSRGGLKNPYAMYHYLSVTCTIWQLQLNLLEVDAREPGNHWK
jgi:hypothetical protein